ncbi:MAG: carboxypeptidase regulatory-like domain-containing protein, partial [Chitinophagaceae bacterium]|nr:carboxypeptidase regulatory-like domain-containing protein [Chitinophagaceae bacterium]
MQQPCYLEKAFVITLYFIFVPFLSQAQQLINKQVSLHLSQQPLYTVLEQIGRQGSFYFSYNSSLIPGDSLVSLSITRKTVWQALDLLFHGTLQYKESQGLVILQRAYTQAAKGYVTDAASGKPLAGVTVTFNPSGASAMSDSNGYYILRNLPLGRYNIEFSSIGYEERTVSDIVIASGKENEQDVTLTEQFRNLDGVVVTSSRNRIKPLNEFATASARSFSIEDTKRYPAAFSDPARMVMNFPGVAAADDGDNSVVVRGNSPAGVLWKLEGIEIPTPNHFSNLGATGGPVSMLSSNVIGKSDFYVGAFPAEIGNATSAAFDLNFRNGNKDRQEHSVMLGTLGVELSTEGPLGKKKNASYLINYRYSTLALIQSFINLGGNIPDYQDLSFKINWKTSRSGEFSLFGLGGYNDYGRDALKDSTKWDSDELNLSYSGNSTLGVAGLTHQIFLNENSYFKTVV